MFIFCYRALPCWKCSGEGVNIVNSLASQWGELMTNVGDFDGKTNHGSTKFGGDGESLVRSGDRPNNM